MELVLHDLDAFHLLVGDLSSHSILAAIQPAGHQQARGGGGVCNQADDGFIVRQRFSAPIRADERKRPVFHLVPLARPGREMTDGDGKAQLICQTLEFQLPQPMAIPVAPPTVGGDQKPLGPGIQAATFRTPPAPDRGNRELSGIMVGTHHHVTPVARQVVDAVGVGARHLRMGEIMALDPQGFALFCAICARRSCSFPRVLSSWCPPKPPGCRHAFHAPPGC